MTQPAASICSRKSVRAARMEPQSATRSGRSPPGRVPELSRAFAGGPSSTTRGTSRRALARRFPENDHNVYGLARAFLRYAGCQSWLIACLKKYESPFIKALTCHSQGHPCCLQARPAKSMSQPGDNPESPASCPWHSAGATRAFRCVGDTIARHAVADGAQAPAANIHSVPVVVSTVCRSSRGRTATAVRGHR